MTDAAPSTADPLPPREVVERFLAACVAADFAAIPTFLADDLVYQNVGFSTIRGPRGTVRFLRMMFGRPGTHFDVLVHRIVAEGDTVLTERTDVSIVGPLRFQFWVCGVFEVRDGRITLWRDYFDAYDVAKCVVRAVLGAVVPALRPRLPRAAQRV